MQMDSKQMDVAKDFDKFLEQFHPSLYRDDIGMLGLMCRDFTYILDETHYPFKRDRVVDELRISIGDAKPVFFTLSIKHNKLGVLKAWLFISKDWYENFKILEKL